MNTIIKYLLYSSVSIFMACIASPLFGMEIDGENDKLLEVFVENPAYFIGDQELMPNVIKAIKVTQNQDLKGRAQNELKNHVAQQQINDILTAGFLMNNLQNNPQQAIQHVMQDPQLIGRLKNNPIVQPLLQQNIPLGGQNVQLGHMLGQVEQQVQQMQNMQEAVNNMTQGIQEMGNDLEVQVGDLEGWANNLQGDFLAPFNEPLPNINEPNIAEEEKKSRIEQMQQILERREKALKKIKEWVADQGEKEKPEQSWFEAQLNKTASKKIYTLDSNVVINALNNGFGLNIAPLNYNFDFKCAISGYDAAKIMFLMLQLAIEKKFFDSFRSYVTRSYCVQFDQRKEALVEVYKQALINPKIKIENALSVAFIKNFCVKSRFAWPLFQAVAFEMALRWGLDGVEKHCALHGSPADTVSSVIKHVITHYGEPVQPGQAQAIPVTINPAQWAVSYIRSKTGLSMVYEMAKASRSSLMGLVRSQYPPEHWYHKFLVGMEKVTEHQYFDMTTRLYMWYTSINHIYDLSEASLRNYMQLHMRDLVTCVSNVAQAQKGSPEALAADAELKAFIERGVCDKNFGDLLKQKNSAYIQTGKTIEWYLNLPVMIEVIKLYVKWARMLMQTFA